MSDGTDDHSAVSWPRARDIAAGAAEPLPARPTPLDRSAGLVLAGPLTALSDLPSFDSAAMDGWVVAGPGPWRVRGRILAGEQSPAKLSVPLRDGEAMEIATGAPLPHGSTAVLRAERGEYDGARLRVTNHADLAFGTDIRPIGQECRRGDRLAPTGTLVTPVLLGLAAAAGYDTLNVHERPSVAVLVLGDEIAPTGVPNRGTVRDAIGPVLRAWLEGLAADVRLVRLSDDGDRLLSAVASAKEDVIITTGGTAAGPVDHVHGTLRRLGAQLLVDGVAVRPGHPMLLARYGRDRYVVGLPGNPLAAIAGFLTLAAPLLRRLLGREQPARRHVTLRADVPGHARDARLVPVHDGVPRSFGGPAMLRGLALSDGLAVIPPGGVRAGATVELLPAEA